MQLICVGLYEYAFVKWANHHQVDFDWQVVHMMPDGHVYIIDAFIKTGDFCNLWIEVKGWLSTVGKKKWEWFHTTNPLNSQLWNKPKLVEFGVITKRGKPVF